MPQRLNGSTVPLAGAPHGEESAPAPESEAEARIRDEHRLAEAVGALHLNIARLREQLGRPSGLTVWDAGVLEWQARELGARLSPRIRDRHEVAIAALAGEARVLALEVRAAYARWRGGR